MRTPNETEVRGFDVPTLVAVANTLGISRARWDNPEELRAIMLRQVRAATHEGVEK